MQDILELHVPGFRVRLNIVIEGRVEITAIIEIIQKSVPVVCNIRFAERLPRHARQCRIYRRSIGRVDSLERQIRNKPLRTFLNIDEHR